MPRLGRGGNGHHAIGKKGTALSVDDFGHLRFQITVTRTASPISKMLSSTTHVPIGRLAMPKTRRVDVLSAPNTLTSNSDAASATFGCSRNSGVVASETPRRTTRV